MKKTEFIERIAGYVEKYAYVYGIMVHSPIIAQAILESGWGESKLASLYHNYFGLKCGTRWTGKSVNMKTSEEYTPGVHTQIRDNFRVYDSMEEGVRGYFEFIQLDRYRNLRGVTDPQRYLENIKADGYATSSTYVDNLMKLVRQYNLTQYDKNAGKEDLKVGYSRQKVADQAEAWVGLKESDGSFKAIIDIYNSKEPFPRGTKMLYSWPWCAATWSAIAKKLGYTAVMPVEISCYYIIEEAKKMGCWQEADNYVPNIGDGVLYDWEDSGSGDNHGAPDHIGTVTYVNRSAGYFVVTEGNYSRHQRKIHPRIHHAALYRQYSEGGKQSAQGRKERRHDRPRSHHWTVGQRIRQSGESEGERIRSGSSAEEGERDPERHDREEAGTGGADIRKEGSHIHVLRARKGRQTVRGIYSDGGSVLPKRCRNKQEGAVLYACRNEGSLLWILQHGERREVAVHSVRTEWRDIYRIQFFRIPEEGVIRKNGKEMIECIMQE